MEGGNTLTKLTQIESLLLDRLDEAIDMRRYEVADTIASILIKLNMMDK